MKRFRRIGVFLHDSPAMDEALAFAGRFAELAESESVLCIHVRETSESQGDPEDDEFRQEIMAKVPSAVAGRTTIEAHGGQGIPAILRAARDQELDLVVVGRRLPSEQLGIGAAFTKLARKAPCNVLVVPNHTRPHMERMLVPVDFSDHSRLALEQAAAIAQASARSTPQVFVHAVGSVGYGHKKAGISLAEAQQELERTTLEKLREFAANTNTHGVPVEAVFSFSEDTERAILEMAAVRKLDMIVVGSRGKTWSTAVLLGSTAERILVQSPLPLLVVKEKGETTRFLEALLGS